MNPRSSWWIPVWGWGSLVVVAAGTGLGLGLLLASADLTGGAVALGAVGASASLVTAALTLAVGVAAVCASALELVAPGRRWRRAVEHSLMLVGGVPPIVVGAAIAAVLPGLPVLLAWIALGVLAVPPLVAGFRRVMAAVEPEERLAAAALGATRLQVLLRVVGPASVRGAASEVLRAGVLLFGLAAPLLVVGSLPADPLPLAAVRYAAAGELGVAALMAVVLLAMTVAGGALAAALQRGPTWRMR